MNSVCICIKSLSHNEVFVCTVYALCYILMFVFFFLLCPPEVFHLNAHTGFCMDFDLTLGFPGEGSEEKGIPGLKSFSKTSYSVFIVLH